MGIIVIECSIDSGTMHTVHFSQKQDKVIGCCIPNKNIDVNKISGNIKLLKNKLITPIYSYDSLNKFSLLLENKINNSSNLSKYDIHQLKFSL